VIPADCHNSVNGIRGFADVKGATVNYLESTPVGGFDEKDAKVRFILLFRGLDHVSYAVTDDLTLSHYRPFSNFIKWRTRRNRLYSF
jgi:hypothetical protein